ncbi:AAA family ATPase [Chlorobium phaeovibrioides]|uniref:AAA family ATPase n=1 Tax=Chlorobium phaeovibrioides TaxID=1094 RepID=A0A3S0L4J3_CHLPH|nr:ATP-binding protein [Chlorobium phaeovibrioides]RTY34683.1 AAA family ATPase [Chlorobium phaeovibrioides]
MLDRVKEQLVAMKLHGMAEALEAQLRTPFVAEMDFTERLQLLVEQEKSFREDRKLTILLRKARLRYPGACIEELHMNPKRGITKATVMDLARLSRVQLLIIDDWGMTPLNDAGRRDILEIMEDRHNVQSTLISTQYPVSEWHRLIDDPTLADAICDRLIHNAYQIPLKGESMRKMLAKLD